MFFSIQYTIFNICRVGGEGWRMRDSFDRIQLMTSLALWLVQAIICLFILVVGIFYAFSLIAAVYSAPYVGSKKQDIRDMLELADIRPGMKVLELGSGKGTLCVMSAKKGAFALGFEINPILIVYSKILSGWHRVGDRAVFKWSDFWKQILPAETEVVYLYLLPEFMSKVWDKLECELKTGTLVISNGFVFKDRPVCKSKGNIKVYKV